MYEGTYTETESKTHCKLEEGYMSKLPNSARGIKRTHEPRPNEHLNSLRSRLDDSTRDDN